MACNCNQNKSQGLEPNFSGAQNVTWSATEDFVKLAVISEIISQAKKLGWNDEYLKDILSLAFIESRFNPSAVSSNGFTGIGQLSLLSVEEGMHRKFRKLGYNDADSRKMAKDHAQSANLKDYRQNIFYMITYYEYLQQHALNKGKSARLYDVYPYYCKGPSSAEGQKGLDGLSAAELKNYQTVIALFDGINFSNPWEVFNAAKMLTGTQGTMTETDYYNEMKTAFGYIPSCNYPKDYLNGTWEDFFISSIGEYLKGERTYEDTLSFLQDVIKNANEFYINSECQCGCSSKSPDDPDPGKMPAYYVPPPISPIILDLDGDGVETVSLKNGVYFDHDNNGFAEKSGWVVNRHAKMTH